MKIGDIIKQRREGLGLSQEDLCNGIIEVSTLSRIENSKHFPNARTLQAIIERLGVPVERYQVLMTQKDFEMKECCDRIIEHSTKREYTKVLELIKELEESEVANESIMQQFIIRSKAVALADEIDDDEFLDIITMALRKTIPNFSDENIENYLLNTEEIKCVNTLAVGYIRKGERRRAIRIYEKLLNTINRRYLLGEEICKIVPPIGANLSKQLCLEGRFEEAIEVCTMAKTKCIDGGKMRFLPNILMNEAYALCKLENMEMGEQLFKQAYYMLKGTTQEALAKELLERVNVEFNISLK